MKPGKTENSAKPIVDMSRVIAHRGPDDEGMVFLPELGNKRHAFKTSDSAKGLDLPELRATDLIPHRIAFGHRRFSIFDVTVAGHQPFWSADGKVVLSFNGEIYNFLELRKELEGLGFRFHTASDTEVLVSAYQAWGTDCLTRLNGFWALSLYDAERDAVLLARDRLGKAPLYVSRLADRLAWSSEIKGLRTLGGNDVVRSDAVSDFVLHGLRDVDNGTFFSNITTFPSGAYAWIDQDGNYAPQEYWSLPQSRMSDADVNDDDIIQRFRELLTDAVSIRMRADVPIGFELSGGLDSSSLVAIAANAGYSLNAFSVKFPAKKDDEEPYARLVAERYSERVNYTVMQPPEDEFITSADEFIALMEEPFHFPNMLTNQKVWRNLKASGMRISINGAAGDETLAGYAEYFKPYLKHLQREGKWPLALSEAMRFSELRGAPIATFGKVLRSTIKRSVAEKDALAPSIFQIDNTTATRATGPSLDVTQRLIDNMGNWRMNYWLRSGNQSSMGVPIEVRMPFLDYRIVEFAFSLPLRFLIRDGWLKWILRRSVEDILPSKVVWRKAKMGFPFPIVEWLLLHERQFVAAVNNTDCPYIGKREFAANYGVLAKQQPAYLWRLISVALWWQRSMRKEALRWN